MALFMIIATIAIVAHNVEIYLFDSLGSLGMLVINIAYLICAPIAMSKYTKNYKIAQRAKKRHEVIL